MAPQLNVLEGVNEVYVIEGPSSIVVSTGRLEIFGVEIGPGERIVVPVGRRVAALLSGKAEISGGTARKASREAYIAFEAAARKIAGLEGRTLLVGPTDSGKSTLAAWAASLAESKLLTVDVGQNEYYAPAFATLVRPPRGRPLIPGSSADIVWNCFVGSFSPSEELARYISCASRLSSIAGGGQLVVDTDGWVDGPAALEAKLALAEAVTVDNIVFIGADESFRVKLSMLLPQANAALTIPKPPGLEGKSREDRRAHRERLLALRLVGGRDVPLNASRVPIAGSPVFACRDSKGPDLKLEAASPVVYLERCGGRLVVVFRRKPREPLPRGVLSLVEGWERGRLAGIVDEDGMHHLALVTRVNYRSRTFVVRTQFNGVVRGAILGRARVNLNLGA